MSTSTTPLPIVRIGLLDFEPLCVAGLREILTSRANFEVGSADLTASFRKQQFDLVILLARRRAESYVLLGRMKVRHPAMKAIVMAREGDDDTIMSAISAGAKGWLEETASPDQVLQAVDIVLSGSIWAPRRVLSRQLTGRWERLALRCGLRYHGLRSAKRKCCSSWCWPGPTGKLPGR
jgi:DNA-binding NarL/FixJ family response regulator